jgi:hypothetical protein
MPLVGSKVINSATTAEKIRTLARTRPEMASYLSGVLGQGDVAPQNTDAPTQENRSLDRYTRNVIQTLFSPEVATESGAENNREAEQKITPGEGHDVAGPGANLKELLMPVSSAIGSTLGTLTNVMKDPMGSVFALPSSMSAVVDKINPDFANALDGAAKKLKLDELANLPGQVMGSLRNLAMAADAILSVPFSMISDLYNGLMDEISGLIDSAIAMIQNFFFGPGGILDSIIPISIVMEFLDALGEVASFAGDISSIAGGFSAIGDIAGQVTSMTSQFSSALSNPMALAQQYVPQIGQVMGQVSQAQSMLRSPEQLLSNVLPPEVSGQLKNIQKISGLGFTGNMGFGLNDVLQTASSLTKNQIFSKLSKHSAILNPLLNMGSQDVQAVNNEAKPEPQEIKAASTNPNIPVIQGVPVQLTARPRVIPTKDSQQLTASNSNNFNPISV